MSKKEYQIDIDSYIGSWYSSKRFVKNLIAEIGSKAINIRVNSLGGDVDTAIDIAAQFEAHGNITCDMYAFNASAATVLTLGAKKVRMHENAMYLIHKALVWVDAWGAMNEDDLEATIEELKNKKENSAAVTLNLAKMYSNKSGKDINDILNLMKEEKWLNAETAKEWGFVDEIFTGSFETKEKSDIVNMLNVAELPIPTNLTEEKEVEEVNPEINESEFKIMWPKFKGFLSRINNKDDNMSKITTITATNTLKILNIEKLEATDDKVTLTAEQIEAIENAISEKETAKTDLQKEVDDKDEEITNLKKDLKNAKAAPADESNGVNKEGDDLNNDEPAHLYDNSAAERAMKLFDALP